MKRIGIFCLGLWACLITSAQGPTTWPAGAIFQQIQKLKVLGSVLYIAAHPDDENTRLITYLANDRLYRTGYLSLTRGDGGQNLIGEEQGVDLGLIRTQELLAARRIDGGEQFFSRAFDFGFSKNPEETFQFWNKDLVLADVVWVIRQFQPDVIITRFPTTGEGGHGHHTASAILASEAFTAAADPKKFPEQLKFVSPWKAARLLWNTFNFGGNNTIESSQFKIDAGGYNALLGKSYGEIAALSRSQHKSQGFGSAGTRGESWEFFKTLAGPAPQKELMDGVDISWARIGIAGKSILEHINLLAKNFNLEKPQSSVPGLVSLYTKIEKLPKSYWRSQKLEEVASLLRECSGLFFRAVTPMASVRQGAEFKINLSVNNRLGAPLSWESVTLGDSSLRFQKSLAENKNENLEWIVSVPEEEPLSQPYWLREKMTKGNYVVKEQMNIGKPDADPPYTAEFGIRIEQKIFRYRVPVMYHHTDPVKGELYQPLVVVPKVMVQAYPGMLLFQQQKISTQPIQVQVLSPAWSPNEKWMLQVAGLSEKTPIPYEAGQNNTSISIPNKNLNTAVTNLYIQASEEHSSKVKYDKSLRQIEYDHIPSIHYFYTDSIKLLNIDLKVQGKQIGYIPGAGDRVPEVLTQMGYQVTLLDQKALEVLPLTNFDAIITGVRAYNVHEWLNIYYDKLMAYIKNGGNLIVQYNTNNNIGPVKAKIGPYEFNISRNRVTDEQAAVTFIDPKVAVLNWPNQITTRDFDDWIQERSTYHGAQWNQALEPVFSMHDPGETSDNGSLLIGKFGKGYFTYSGLAFFRQLPAGVPGAIRLFANIIALNQKNTNK